MTPEQIEEREWQKVQAKHERLPCGWYVPKPAKLHYRYHRVRNPETWCGYEKIPAGVKVGGRNASEWRTPKLPTKQNPRAYKLPDYTPKAVKLAEKVRTFEIAATNTPHKRCAFREMRIRAEHIPFGRDQLHAFREESR